MTHRLSEWPTRLAMAVTLSAAVLLLGLTAGASAGTLRAGADRHPVAQADWRLWLAADSAVIDVASRTFGPRMSACAKSKTLVAIGKCVERPFADLSASVRHFQAVVLRIAMRTAPGQCRSAALAYISALRENLESSLQGGRYLRANDIAAAQTQLAISAKTKRAEQQARARSYAACRPI